MCFVLFYSFPIILNYWARAPAILNLTANVMKLGHILAYFNSYITYEGILCIRYHDFCLNYAGRGGKRKCPLKTQGTKSYAEFNCLSRPIFRFQNGQI